MSTNNGMNYPMYNTIPYAQMTQQQQQSFYGHGYPNSFPQQPVPPYGAYQMYPSLPMPNPPHYNSYDPVIRSAAQTLAAFTNPNEPPIINGSHAHFTLSKSQQSSTRRPAKNFTGTTNPPRMYYCETCRIACGGHATYQAHLNGSKHKKKELVAQSQQTSVNLSSKIGVNILRCELCDITCTSSDAYKAHLDGSKHDKAMKLHRKLGKTIPSTEPKILNPTPASSQSTSISQLPINGSQTLPDDEQQITLSRLLENSNKPIGEEYIETTYDSTNKPVLYRCKLCECTFNDIKGKEMHLKGKRHRLSYKKKVNPSFVVENNSDKKLSTSKPKSLSNNMQAANETVPSIEHRNIQQLMDSDNQSETDDDTKCLMMLHQQIVPAPNLLHIVEQFVSVVESALKSCSEKLQSSVDNNSSTSEASNHQSPLMGVSRIGLLGKSLMIRTDRLFQIVVICTEWPSKQLLQTIAAALPDNFDDVWKNQIQLTYEINQETIELQTNTAEGIMHISIAFTSPVIQQDQYQDKSDEFLSKQNCLDALYSIHSTRWFQNQVSVHQHASALVRCLRYKTKISSNWQSLSSEVIEILIAHALSQCTLPVNIFRRVLEYLSGGLVLANGPSLCIPWQTNSTKDIFEDLTNQQRDDITQEAQTGLRLMAFGRLIKWLEQSTDSQLMVSLTKRSYCDSDNQLSTKRQCTKCE